MRFVIFILLGLSLLSCNGTTRPASRNNDNNTNKNSGTEYLITGAQSVIWFNDDERSVSYCLDYDDDFGIGKEAFLNVLEDSLNTWKAFYTSSNISNKIADFSQLNFFPGVTFNFVQQATCDGDEDLRFSLGTENKEASTLRETYGELPLYAYLENYSFSQKWAKGIVWYAPQGYEFTKGVKVDYAVAHSLRALTLRAIGLMLGLPTGIEGTIMRSGLHSYIWSSSKNKDTNVYTRLEYESRFIAPFELDKIYQGAAWGASALALMGVEATNFSQVTLSFTNSEAQLVVAKKDGTTTPYVMTFTAEKCYRKANSDVNQSIFSHVDSGSSFKNASYQGLRHISGECQLEIEVNGEKQVALLEINRSARGNPLILKTFDVSSSSYVELFQLEQ